MRDRDGQKDAGGARSAVGMHGHKDGVSAEAEAFAVGALERLPAPAVPAGFAARTAAAALRQPAPSRSPWQGFGMRMALASGVVLTLGLFALAPHAEPSFLSLRFDVEMLLLGELGGVAYLAARLGLPE